MGTKTTSENTSNSSFSPPPQVMANYQAVTQQAQGVAATPYQGYGGPLVAGINGQQTTGINAVNSASGVQDPYNAGATGLASASTGAIDPTQFSPDQIQQYESPYQSDVINATEAQIQNQNQQQAASLRGNAISSGAFGGDRAGIAQAALAGQQDIANNATLANLNNQNYAQALGEFNTQQGVGLGAAQNTAQRQLAGAGVLGQLGQTAQGEALNEANAQTNAGTLQQTTQQAQDTAAYNQFLQQQAYPFETTGWLANIVEGIGSQSGGSSAGTTTTQGNAGSQVAGGLLGLASFLARGGRVPHRAAGGGIYLPQFFDPTTAGPIGIGGGQFVPAGAPLAVGHTMPTQGAPAPAAAPASPLTPQAVQAAGKGLKDAYGKMSAPSTPLTIDAAANAAPDALGDIDTGSMASLSDAGLGGIFARGGIVRPRFAGGGSPDGSAASGQTWAPTNMRTGAGGYSGPLTPRAAPMPVGNAKPAGAANYSVFPQQMSDGTWSTTQDVARGIAALGFGGFADGGRLSDNVEDRRGDLPAMREGRASSPEGIATHKDIKPWPYESDPDKANDATADISHIMGGNGPAWHVPGEAPLNYARGGIARRHYDDGGVVPSGDPMFDLSPESLLLSTMAPPTGIAAASQLSAPPMSQQKPDPVVNQMPAPNVAQETQNAATGLAGQMPVPAMAADGPPIPVPPVRPADLGAAPEDAPTGIVAPAPSESDQTFRRMIGDESGGHQFSADGQPLTSPKGAIGVAQVMPGTGPEAAKLAGLPWDPAKLATDRDYNLTLGKAYYQAQLANFGSPEKAAAAYNAGPGAVKRAMAAANANGGSYLDYLPKETQDYVANATGAAPALAFDGGRGGANAPAAAAIDAAAPLSGIAPARRDMQVSAPQFPDQVPTPESGRTGLFGLNLSPETRQLMLSAGLGIAGAQGRSFLGNVGTGATAGIAAMRQNANLSSEAALRNTQTQGAAIENQMKSARLKMMMDALNNHADTISSSANGTPSPTTPTVTAPTVAGKAGAAASAAAAPQLDPEFDPAALVRRADQAMWIDPQVAANLRERANQILQSGRSRTVDGSIINLPGFTSAEAELAANKTGAESAAKSHYEMKEVTQPDSSKVLVPQSSLLAQSASGTPALAALPGYVTEGQNQLMKEEPAITSALQNRQQARQRLYSIGEIMQNYQTGKWAEPSADIVAHLKAAGIPITSTDTANPEAYEKFIKNQMKNVFSDVAAMGGQPRVAEIQGFKSAAAGPSLQPGSNTAILGQGLGILDSLDKHDNDYIKAKYGPGGNPAMSSRLAFDQGWIGDPKNRLQNFIDAETKNLSYKGQPAPKSPQEAVVGQVYQSPSGKRMRWTGTGWVPAPWGSGHESKPFGAAMEAP